MRLTHAAQQGLVRFRVALDAHHRIFVLQPVQRVRELVLVGLGLGVDRDREHGLGERELGSTSTLDALGGEQVAGCEVVQLGDGGDVAGRDLAHGVLFLAAHREELVDPFVGLRADVHEHVVVLHRALQHLEQVHVADVRVDDRLEHLEDRRAFRRGRRRTFLDEERHQTVDADELGRASAQNGEHRRARDTVGERVRELFESRSSRRSGSAP